MIGNSFRPWGEIKWLLSKSSQITWDVIGSISFEERCYGLYSQRSELNLSGNNLYFDISPSNLADLPDHNRKLIANRMMLENFGVNTDCIIEAPLLGPINSFMEDTISFINKSNGNVILDISSFPKRFFFAILKRLIISGKITNLLLAYSESETYTHGRLSEDPSEWAHLPTFLPDKIIDTQVEVAVVGVGFMPLGLPKLLIGKYQSAQVNLLFPYPAGPPYYQRGWEFVRKIEDQYPNLDLKKMYRISALDMSDAFNRLCSITNDGAKSSILAPYGPKPISAAMALFAIHCGVPVYYTQPNYYSPNYSTGVGDTKAYWVINNSRNLYG